MLRFLGRLLLWICAILGGLALALSVASLVLLWSFAGKPVKIPEGSTLIVDLNSGVLEKRANLPAWAARFDNRPALADILFSLQAAAKDPHIAAIYLELGHGTINLAHGQEIRDAIHLFRASGKKVYAFAEDFGDSRRAMPNYYVAASADQIYLQPSADLHLAGFSLEVPFLKGGLDRLGIAARVDQRKEYKGIAFTFTEEAMPESQRRNMQALVDSWLAQFVEGVSADRHLDPARLRDVIDRGALSAQAALDAGLADHLAYAPETEEAVLGQEGASRHTIDLADYAAQLPKPPQSAKRIALIYASGPLHGGTSKIDPMSGEATIGAKSLQQEIRQALADHVDAILLRIDSPGGEYGAGDTLWREIARAGEKGVPVIVSMGELAASGGYFIAAPAAYIVADPATLTGSIGVAGGKAVLTGLWQKLSVAIDAVAAGKEARIDSPNVDYSAEGWQTLEESLDRIYADFTQKVADGRHLPGATVEEMAKGQVWTGQQAKDRQLVDALGGLMTAIDSAKSQIGLAADAPVQLVRYPGQRETLGAAFGKFFGSDTMFGHGIFGSIIRLALMQGGAQDPLQSLALRAEAALEDPRIESLRLPPLVMNGALR